MAKTKLLILTILTVLAAGPLAAQSSTPGYTPGRTYFNSNAGPIRPPFELVKTIPLASGDWAGYLAVAGTRLLVESFEEDDQGRNRAVFTMIDETSGETLWAVAADRFGFAPEGYPATISNDVVFLATDHTTGVRAVSVVDGSELWRDDSVGWLDLSPLVENGLALYGGSNALVAARARTGDPYWRIDRAEFDPFSGGIVASGGQVYLFDRWSVVARDLLTGEEIWSVPPIQVVDYPGQLLATEDQVFVASSANSSKQNLTALRAASGQIVWQVDWEDWTETRLAYAYHRLFALQRHRSGSGNRIAALDPATGQELWSHDDDGSGPPHGQVANNLVFYQCWDRIQALDAFTGRLVWSREVDGLTHSVIENGRLYLLFPEKIEIYEPAHVQQLPQIVDGQGASTLFSIVNLSQETNSGTLEFFDDDGAPLSIALEGQDETAIVIPFSLEPSGSIRIRTTGSSETLSWGWARVRSAQPTSAAATYQVILPDGALFEASVDAAEPTGSATVSVIRAAEFGGLTNTGLALVNVSDAVATVDLEFRRQLPTAGVLQATITLEPGQHLARFLDELFGGEETKGAEGTVLIRSNRPIAVTALRTHDGLPVSSYPVGFPGP